MKKTTAIAILAAATSSWAYLISQDFAVAEDGKKKEDAPAQQEQQAPPPMPVTVAKVMSRSVQEWHEFSGRLEATEHVQIVPRVGGTIESVHFDDGAMVKKGDLLFTIDPKPYEAEVKRAEAAVASARAQNALSKSAIARAKRLLDDKAIAKREYDEIENQNKLAGAGLQSAEAQLTTAQLDLGYTKITAPIAGRIGRAEITVGNVVHAGNMNPNPPVLSSIVSSSPVYAAFDMDEQTYISYARNDSALAQEKIPATMSLANNSDKTWEGTVDSFDNRLDPVSGTVRVRAIFDDTSGTLIPGLFVKVRVGEPAAQKRIMITDRAINTDQDRKYVYVIGKGNMVEYRPVVLGPVIDGFRAIASGLTADDAIIVNGLQRVRPGMPVTPEMIPMDDANKDPAETQPAAP